MSNSFRVTAQWDGEAGVWVATSDDIIGLVTEAQTLDALYRRVLDVAPELLQENGIAAPDHLSVDFDVLGELIVDAAE